VEVKVYKCPICKKPFAKYQEAYSCFIEHDVIFVPLRRSDLMVLVQWVMNNATENIPDTLIDSLLLYSRQMRGKA
jgi:hypothetical protein